MGVKLKMMSSCVAMRSYSMPSLSRSVHIYKGAHLMFAKNFVVDFTNNFSERDLRICKNRDIEFLAPFTQWNYIIRPIKMT